MGEFFPAQVFKQLSHARAVIERHLAATLDTIHLFGSAIDGGLKPDSDIDLLVTVSAAPNDSLRQALMLDLLKVSSPPGDGGTWRPLELTVVARSGSVAKIVKLEHAWRRLDGRNDDGFQVAPFPG